MLVMDNFRAHILPKDKVTQLTFAGGFNGFQYQNVVCLFLPPNVTSVVQPLDQGIIAAFKAHYRRHHIAFFLDQIREGIKPKSVKINMMQVLRWTREGKKFIEGETIANCWVKSGILSTVQECELKGDGERKTKRGAAKFKADYEKVAKELDALDLNTTSG